MSDSVVGSFTSDAVMMFHHLNVVFVFRIAQVFALNASLLDEDNLEALEKLSLSFNLRVRDAKLTRTIHQKLRTLMYLAPCYSNTVSLCSK